MNYRNLFGRECAPPTDPGYGWRPKAGDIRDELRALRAWMAKRDRDPWHGWTPRVLGYNKDNVPMKAHPLFRTPSAELQRMQAGKPAYGRKPKEPR